MTRVFWPLTSGRSLGLKTSFSSLDSLNMYSNRALSGADNKNEKYIGYDVAMEKVTEA